MNGRAHVLPAEDQLEHLRAAGRSWRTRMISGTSCSSGLSVEIELHREMHLLLRDPVRLQRLQARPRPARAGVDLAALERERDLGGARIAADQPELDAERVLQQRRVDVGIGARALAADA